MAPLDTAAVGGRGRLGAGILQVALVLHFAPHGGIPVVLDGVVRPVKNTLTPVVALM